MKKIMMTVAAVVGLGLSFAHAEVMDFDGRATGALNFKEALETAKEKGGECHAVCYSNGKCATVCTYSKDAGSALATIPAPTPVKVAAFDTKGEEDELNRSIATAIKDCEIKEFAGLKTRFEKLLAEGLLQEKRDFVYNNKQTYEFPRRLPTVTAKADAASDQRKANKGCLTWGSKEVCTTGRKEVCHNVCAASTLVCIAVVGVAAPVCTWAPPACALACAFVDDTKCTMVDYCVAQDTYDGNNDPWGPQPGVAPRYNQ